jgi:nuclear protein 1
MSESHFDEFEHYNYDQEKYLNAGHSGKQRSKLEASQHTNQHDPSGQTRKLVTKMQNTEANRKQQEGPTSKKS